MKESVRRVFVRDVGLVARYEISEAVRTRLLVVMLFLFVGSGALGAWGFSEIVDSIEAKSAEILGAPKARHPGGPLKRLRESGSYHEMLRTFFREDRKADYLAELPPIVVFFGWASFMFTPWLVLFTSADTLATEVGSRAIRYSALRTGRLQYALGKGLGQLAIVAGVTALSALTFFLVAGISMNGFEAGATLVGLASYWPRVLVFNLPFLGWALMASMMTASANQARILSLAGAVGLSILSGVAHHRAGNPVWDLMSYLTPFGHRDGLLVPVGGAVVLDLVLCVALTVIYFSAGYVALKRRDI